MITRDDVRRCAMRRAARPPPRTAGAAEPGRAWPQAERRRWSCALNDYGWRCAPPVGRGWFEQGIRARELRGVRMCIVDTARPGMRQTGEETITGADRA